MLYQQSEEYFWMEKQTDMNKKELENYPGANLDTNYDRQKDGGKKWQSLVKSLQEN